MKIDPSKVVILIRRHLKLTIDYKHDDELTRKLKRALTLHKVVPDRSRRGRISYETEQIPIYTQTRFKENTSIHTGAGFFDRVTKIIKDSGYVVKVLDKIQKDRAAIAATIPDPKMLESLTLRPEQTAVLKEIDMHDYGQFIAATGSGKTFLIRTLCRYYPNAKFLITTYSLKLLEDIYRDLTSSAGLNVSLFTSRQKDTSGRIQLCSIDSLDHFIDTQFDIMIVDERQEACTSKRTKALMNMRARRCYGFSANENDRADKADILSESVAGPVRYRATYESSVQANSVVPVRVDLIKYNARLQENLNSASPTFARHAFWRNDERNEVIARAIREYSQHGQVLVYVKTVEHVYALRQLYHCPVVHAEQEDAKWLEWQKRGLVEPNEKQPTSKTVAKLSQDFRAGKIPVIIANSVWKRGVDFPSLSTVILAHGGSSAEEIIQAAGRVTRVAEGKNVGIVVDLNDGFCDAVRNRVVKRKSIYRSQKWTLNDVDWTK